MCRRFSNLHITFHRTEKTTLLSAQNEINKNDFVSLVVTFNINLVLLKLSKMFHKNSRNSFLLKSCNNLPKKTLDKNMQNVFFRHLKGTEKDQQVYIIKEFNDFKRYTSKGFGDIGLENLVSFEKTI